MKLDKNDPTYPIYIENKFIGGAGGSFPINHNGMPLRLKIATEILASYSSREVYALAPITACNEALKLADLLIEEHNKTC